MDNYFTVKKSKKDIIAWSLFIGGIWAIFILIFIREDKTLFLIMSGVIFLINLLPFVFLIMNIQYHYRAIMCLRYGHEENGILKEKYRETKKYEDEFYLKVEYMGEDGKKYLSRILIEPEDYGMEMGSTVSLLVYKKYAVLKSMSDKE